MPCGSRGMRCHWFARGKRIFALLLAFHPPPVLKKGAPRENARRCTEEALAFYFGTS